MVLGLLAICQPRDGRDAISTERAREAGQWLVAEGETICLIMSREWLRSARRHGPSVLGKLGVVG